MDLNKRARIKFLTELLNQASMEYYMNNNSIMPDVKFDNYYDELLRLEKEENFMFSNSPTNKIGYEVLSNLEKVKHSELMMSLDKTKDLEKFAKFANGKECIISCKMDGLTIKLTYENGELIQAETRGNGEVGEIVTQNAKVFDNIPLKIPHKEHFEINGEAIITYYDFDKINENIDKDVMKYKNPRNLASGSVRQLDSNIAKQRHIKFIAWKIPKGFDKNSDAFRFANNLGFDTAPMVVVRNEEDIKAGVLYLQEMAKELGYPIDGLVMTYNDIKYGKSLGVTEKFPKHSLAFKFYDEEYQTTLTDIEWTVGRTGKITPTAIFEPVEIDGTEVSRASVHNVSVLTNLDLQIGDTVSVIKANMIIPQITENLSVNTHKNAYIKIPGKCPVCGGVAEIQQENDSKILMCINSYCPAKLIKRLAYFTSRDMINIDGLSEATLEKFVKYGYLKSFKDIFYLKNFYNQLINLDGFGKKSINKILEHIEKSRCVSLACFIGSQGIDLIGLKASKLIERHVSLTLKKENSNITSIEKFFSLISKKYDWTVIDGFGEKMSSSLNNYFTEHMEEIVDLAKEFTFVNDDASTSENNNKSKLNGKTFVITGSVIKFKNRKDVQKFIEEHGGKVSGSVSNKTSYLVNNDSTSNSGKNKKAKELNIPIVTEIELLDMVK